MNSKNIIDEKTLLLERKNLKSDCNISDEQQMYSYLVAYNTYNNLLIQFLMKEYYIKNFDDELLKHSNEFKAIDSEEKDLYQSSSEGFLKYFYLRNNIYIERLSNEDIKYLYKIYKSNNFVLDEQKEEFIKRTYLNTILENPTQNNQYINYGPNNKKFIRPSNAIIIGVRYDEFNNCSEEDVLETFTNREFMLQTLIEFFERRVKNKTKLPFYVIKYDEYRVKSIKKTDNVIKK